MAIRKINAELVYKDENEHGEPEYGNRITFAVNSADEKPSGELTNGSVCIEVDTGKIFLWDEEQGDWIEQFSIKGGGSNYTQTLQGMTDSVFQSMTEDELTHLVESLYSGDASGEITIDASALGSGEVKYPLVAFGATSDLYASSASITSDESLAGELQWSSVDGSLTNAHMEQSGTITDIAPHAAYAPATVTIYWHPMS